MNEDGQTLKISADFHILGLLDLELLEKVVRKVTSTQIFNALRGHPADGFRNICSSFVGEEKLSS